MYKCVPITLVTGYLGSGKTTVGEILTEKYGFEKIGEHPAFFKIDDENILRTLAIFKITNPNAIIRFCGGRMRLSDENQELALKTCVEGILTGNYLTTTGKSPQDDIKTLEKLNKKLKRI